jgi:hypothetical protein
MFQATIEGDGIKAEAVRIRLELFNLERLWMVEQKVVHGPILALLPGAVGGLSGFAGLRV